MKIFSRRGRQRAASGYKPGIFEMVSGSKSGKIKEGVVGKTVNPPVLRINIPLGRKKFVKGKRRKKK